jgi:hypothetical protein
VNKSSDNKAKNYKSEPLNKEETQKIEVSVSIFMFKFNKLLLLLKDLQ